MALMSWKNEYSVNVAEIDAQHKKLIELINRLHTAMAQGQAKDVLRGVLDELVAYCDTHFAFEEKLMRENGYPEFREHQQKHQKMTGKVFALKKDVAAGKKTISMEVMQFLTNWLDKHILGTDRQYAPFLNSKGVV